MAEVMGRSKTVTEPNRSGTSADNRPVPDQPSSDAATATRTEARRVEDGPKIGLVLGGGGIAGYAFHAAVLAAVQEMTGYDPRTAEIILGTSAGAIAGAALRGGVATEAVRDRLIDGSADLEELDTLRLLSGRTPRVMPRIWTGPGAPSMAIAEVRRGRKLRMSKLVAALLPQGRQTLSSVTDPLNILHGDSWPDRTLWIPATDLRTGRLTVFGRDRLSTVAEAVAASASLPVYFSPTVIDGEPYIDGGLGSPFNADLLSDRTPPSDEGASAPDDLDLVVILAPLSLDELNSTTPVASAARSLPRRRLRSEVRRLEDGGTTTVVLQPDRAVARAMGLNPMDHRRIDAIVDRSEEMVVRLLPTMSDSAVELLERAAEALPSPADAVYPTVDKTG